MLSKWQPCVSGQHAGTVSGWTVTQNYLQAPILPNFFAIGEACGGKDLLVERPVELSDAIRSAYVSKEAFVLDIRVNSDELLLPPKIKLAQAWGYIPSQT